MSDTQAGAVHLNEDTFDQALKDAGDKPVLVDFFAQWCGPCKMAGPVIDGLADEYRQKAVIAKIDVDENHGLASHYQVMSIPTVIIFKNGQELTRKTGFAGKDGYVQMIEAALKND